MKFYGGRRKPTHLQNDGRLTGKQRGAIGIAVSLLVLAGTLVWIGKQLQDILRRLKEQEYTSLLPNEEKNKALPFYPQLWDAVMNQVDMAKESDAAEEYERQATLQALQSQINPHFLYNTLDSIIWMEERGRGREAILMVSSLARLFRLSISRGRSEITVREELEQVRQVRSVQRERRIKNSIPVVAIVGYTNAGKSTLLNKLTGAGIPANNRLFDTLDTTSRQLTVSDNLDVVLSDTVGFIAKLPHHLVNAFHATLEELEYADLLLHVIDSADPNREEHIAVVDKLIAQLAKPGTPVLRCYNKSDLVSPEDIPTGDDVVVISAANGTGCAGLLAAIERALERARHHVMLCLPYSMGGQVETLHDNAQVLRVDYTADGIEIETVLNDILYGRLRDYVTKEC